MHIIILLAVLFVSVQPGFASQFGVTSLAGPLSQNQCDDYTRYVCLRDEFFGGAAATGLIGEIGWNVFGGNISTGGGIANEIGFYILGSSTTINTTSTIYTQGSGSVIAPGSWDIVWRVRGSGKDANATMQVGVQDTVTTVTPSNGIYFQALDGDTNWFCVTRAAGVQTRTDSGVAVSTTAFQALRHVRSGSASVSFYINGIPVCTHTTNIHAVNTNSVVAIKNSAAANKSIDIGLFALRAEVTR